MRKVTSYLYACAFSVLCLCGSMLVLAPSAALADGGFCAINPDAAACTVTGSGGGSTSGGGSSDPASSTGSTTCHNGMDQEIPCSIDGAWYSPANDCYMQLQNPQSTQKPPLTGGTGKGAWYTCWVASPSICNAGGVFGCNHSDVWLASGPTISPEDAAKAVAATLTVKPISIGMAPQVDPKTGYRHTHVGVPVWLWVADPSPETYDGYTVDQTVQGMKVTGTVKPSGISWAMGDGHTVTCDNAGTPYTASYGWAKSPSCGYIYSHTSSAGGYTVTAATSWTFSWQAGGQAGQIPFNVSSSLNLRVGQLQTVNVAPGS